MKKFIFYILFLTILIPINVYAKEEVALVKCVDGDTAKVMVEGKVYTTRFLAVDTPETKHPKKKEEPFGKQASNYTCNRLMNAKKIELEYDAASDKYDKYDRLLAWVFVDGELLQGELVEKGYAKVAYLYGDYRYTHLLKLEEKRAQVNRRGIWNNPQVRRQEQWLSFEKIIEKIVKLLKSML